MTYFVFLVPPIVGAIIGYCTNFLAIRMLFRPYRPVYFWGVKMPFTPGLIPRGQARLAKKLAQAVGGSIITPDILAKGLISSPLLTEGAMEIKKAIRTNLPNWAEYIRNFENPELDVQGPELVKKIINEHVGKLAGMFLDPAKIYSSIKDGILDYISQEENFVIISDKIDEGIDRFLFDEQGEKDRKKTPIEGAFEKAAAYVANHIDIKAIIESRINAFDPEEAEVLILSVIRRELYMVMALGGVLGFIIGWVPVLFY